MQTEVILPLVAYLLLVFGLSVYAYSRRQSGNFLSEYFLGNRSMGGFVLAMTLTATYISASSFIGGPGAPHRRHHLMLFARQSRQHVRRMGFVARLLQHPAVEHHDGVCAQHRPIFLRQRHARLGLVLRQTAHIGLCGFAFPALLFGMRQQNVKRHAQQGQQFTSTWGAGGQIKRSH